MIDLKKNSSISFNWILSFCSSSKRLLIPLSLTVQSIPLLIKCWIHFPRFCTHKKHRLTNDSYNFFDYINGNWILRSWKQAIFFWSCIHSLLQKIFEFLNNRLITSNESTESFQYLIDIIHNLAFLWISKNAMYLRLFIFLFLQFDRWRICIILVLIFHSQIVISMEWRRCILCIC